MKRIFILPLILLSSLWASSQTTYFDFYYTNLPAQRIDVYRQAFRTAFDRIYLAGYADTCQTCTPIASNAAVKMESLPALRQSLLQYLPDQVYQKNRVPGSYYHLPGTKTAPYIIRTLYTINNDQVVPLYQVKMTFTDDPTPALQNLEVFSPKEGKHFSRKLVLATYRNTVK